MKRIFATILLSLTLLLAMQPSFVQAQCTMCKTNVESARTEKDSYDTSGLNKGILYMMIAPYVLIGTVGFFWYRNSKRRKLQVQ